MRALPLLSVFFTYLLKQGRLLNIKQWSCICLYFLNLNHWEKELLNLFVPIEFYDCVCLCSLNFMIVMSVYIDKVL
jgi:hypothetical protein